MSRARDKANSTVSNFASTGIDDNADATAITIDSSERIGLNKTPDSSVGTVGVEVSTAGQTLVTADNLTPLFINRKSSDGTVLDVRKDGTTVGSIGSKGGDLTIGTGAIGVRFEDSTPAIVPFDTGTLGGSDNDIDLGKSSVRWNDLYLGGGVYLGGTGSANHLDDYEIGEHLATATPSTSGTITLHSGENKLRYTKVGDLVSVHGKVMATSVSSPQGRFDISLPFVVSNGSGNSGRISFSVVCAGVTGAQSSDYVGITVENEQVLRIYLGTSTNFLDSAATIQSNTDIYIGATYRTT